MLTGFGRLRSETIQLTVHNGILKVLSEYGIIGLFAITALLGYLAKQIFRNIGDQRPQGVYAAVSLCILLLNSLTLPLDFQDWLFVTVMCLLGLTLPVAKELPRES